MADDIVKRLRDSEWEDVLHELAADEIERLRQKRAEAEANLEAAHGVVVRLRAALEWLRGWRMKDHESIDCTIQHALGEAETCTVCHPHGNAALAGEAKPEAVFVHGMSTHADHGAVEIVGGELPANVGPSIPEVNDRADAEMLCRLLASIWFYNSWDAETNNERALQAILERRGWWPITEDALLAKARAVDSTPPAPAPDCQHCGGHPGGVDGKGTPCPACGSPGLHRSDCAVNNGPALPVGECDCQPMAKAFIEDVRRSRWLEREHVRCQADCRDECRFPACKCPLRHTTDCDKTLLPSNPRAICTCGADANNRYREIRVNADGTAYAPPSAPASASPNIAESNDRADAAPKCRLPTFKDCGVCMEYPFCGCGAQAWTDRIRVALLPYVRHTHPNCHDVKAPGSTERHGCLCGLADALAMPLVQPPAAPAPESRPVAYECDQCRHPISKPAWTAFEPTCGYCGGTYRPAVQPNEGHT